MDRQSVASETVQKTAFTGRTKTDLVQHKIARSGEREKRPKKIALRTNLNAIF
tara:strand:+ start:283 stop:441 length:159 start_codon:yes stop_codon:yes gene_type:complete